MLAGHIRDAREGLTHRWLERIGARVALEPHQVFPSDDLLDHVPLLIDGIADYMEDPLLELSAEPPVIGKAMELGALRHAQGFDEYQIVKEFEFLGGILFAHLIMTVRDMEEPCAKDELLACGHRLFRAIMIIQQASVARYLQEMRAKLAEREAQLRSFNRALTHELKNQLGAVLGASALLDLERLAPEERAPLPGIIQRNAAAMRETLDNLVELARLDVDVRQQRRIMLRQAVAEASRQLRETSQAAAVRIRLGDLPSVEVPAAVVELAMTNYLSNAIKFANPEAPERFVEVRGSLRELGPGRQPELVVEVVDNGIGVPEEKRACLFAAGFRAHAEIITGVEGTGLGLKIVKDAVEAVGGRVWAAFPPHGGSCFAFALPARRAADASMARPSEVAERR